MISIDQFRTGLGNYADKEIINRLPTGSLKKVLIGSAIALGIQNGLNKVASHDIIKTLGIMNDDMIDIDLLRDVIKQLMDEKINIDVMGINMNFNKLDIDIIYRYIMEANYGSEDLRIDS